MIEYNSLYIQIKRYHFIYTNKNRMTLILVIKKNQMGNYFPIVVHISKNIFYSFSIELYLNFHYFASPIILNSRGELLTLQCTVIVLLKCSGYFALYLTLNLKIPPD